MILREEIETGAVPRLRARNPHYLSLALGLSLVLGWGTAEARAQDGHTVQVLPFPSMPPGPFGPGGGNASSINKKGQIVGSVITPCPVCSLAVIWEGPDTTAPTSLPGAGSAFPGGSAQSINDKGQIVGQVYGPGGVLPVLWAEQRN